MALSTSQAPVAERCHAAARAVSRYQSPWKGAGYHWCSVGTQGDAMGVSTRLVVPWGVRWPVEELRQQCLQLLSDAFDQNDAPLVQHVSVPARLRELPDFAECRGVLVKILP